MRRLALFLSLSLAASCPAIANSATALLVGGTGQYATLTDEQMASAMGGYFADYTRLNVPYPGLPDDFGYSLEVGTDNLYAATYSTAGPKTIGGVSEGAPAVIEVLRRLAKDPNPPAPDELDAVILATLSPVFYFLTGVTYHDVPETPYDVIVVKAEYDGVADWPDNWLNPLAVINAVMGADQLHVSSAFYDIKTVPAKYVISTANSRGGTTTTVLIPTAVLPLLQPLVESGASPGLIDFFDAVLRPIIDSAYRRFWIGTYSARSVAVDAAAAEPLVAVVEPNSSAVLEPEELGAAPDRSSSGTNDHRSDPTAMEGDVESRIDEQSEGSWPSPAPRDVEDPGEESASGDAVASFAAEQQEAAERTEGDESQPSAAAQERGEDQAAASPPESDDVASSAESSSGVDARSNDDSAT